MSCKKVKELKNEAYISSNVSTNLTLNVPFLAPDVFGQIIFDSDYIRKNIGHPIPIEFETLIDGVYRISYSIHVIGSGIRFEASVCKTSGGVETLIPGSLSAKIMSQKVFPSEEMVDNYFLVDLKKGDKIAVKYVISNLTQEDQPVIIGTATNISINKVSN